MATLLAKAGVIHDQTGLWIGQVPSDIGLERIAQGSSVPRRSPQQVLQGVGGLVSRMGGDVPTILTFHGTEQAEEVGARMLAHLAAGEGGVDLLQQGVEGVTPAQDSGEGGHRRGKVSAGRGGKVSIILSI